MPPEVDRVESLRALVQKDPSNALAHYMLANELLKSKRYREALAELDVYFGMTDDEMGEYA